MAAEDSDLLLVLVVPGAAVAGGLSVMVRQLPAVVLLVVRLRLRPALAAPVREEAVVRLVMVVVESSVAAAAVTLRIRVGVQYLALPAAAAVVGSARLVLFFNQGQAGRFNRMYQEEEAQLATPQARGSLAALVRTAQTVLSKPQAKRAGAVAVRTPSANQGEPHVMAARAGLQVQVAAAGVVRSIERALPCIPARVAMEDAGG